MTFSAIWAIHRMRLVVNTFEYFSGCWYCFCCGLAGYLPIIKFARQVTEEFRQHDWQLADGDRCYCMAIGKKVERHQSSLDDHQMRVSALEGRVAGLEGQITMVSGYSESVHHGVVEMCGFKRLTDLIAEERRGFYATERANLVARNAMESNYYLRCVRQEFHGVAGGDGTGGDEPLDNAESE
eukprot:s3100_g10.t1